MLIKGKTFTHSLQAYMNFIVVIIIFLYLVNCVYLQ